MANSLLVTMEASNACQMPIPEIPFPRREWTTADFGITIFDGPAEAVMDSEIAWGCKKGTVALINIVDNNKDWTSVLEAQTIVLLAMCDTLIRMNGRARYSKSNRMPPKTYEEWHSARLRDTDELHRFVSDMLPLSVVPSMRSARPLLIAAVQAGFMPGDDAFVFYPPEPPVKLPFPRSTFGSFAPGPEDPALYGYSLWEFEFTPSKVIERALFDKAVRIANKKGHTPLAQRLPRRPNPLHGLPPKVPPVVVHNMPGMKRIEFPDHRPKGPRREEDTESSE